MCDEHCDSEDQLFDGGDCDPYRYDPCPRGSTAECHAGFRDNICDTNCSAPQVRLVNSYPDILTLLLTGSHWMQTELVSSSS